MTRTGMMYFAIGSLVLIVTLFSGDVFTGSHVREVAAILLTPIGWFGMWEGVGMFVKAPYKNEQQKRFFEKFSKANYVFISEEQFMKELSEAESADISKAEQKK